MTSLPRLVALAAAALAPAVLAAPVAYTLDPNHTQVEFRWNHLQFSNPGASFDGVTGTLMWDADDITRSSVHVDIDVGSVHSRVAALDEKLKTAEFFDVARYPTMTFDSTRVERLETPGHLRIGGTLTLHGISRPVVLDAHVNRVGVYPFLNVPAAGFDATATLKRSEFGLGEGVPMVSDEIGVRITVEALEAVGYARAMKAIAEAAPKQP